MMFELDKFFRCPNCQSYSLSKSVPKFYEKAISLFLPVYIYECSNCSYRYVDRNVTAIKSRLKKGFLLIFLTIIISIIYFTGIFSSNNKPDIPAEKTEIKTVKQETLKKYEKVEDTIVKQVIKETEKKEIIPEETKTDEINSKIEKKVFEKSEKIEIVKDYKYIYFGNSKKYGVNWNKTRNGIIISRISKGRVFDIGGIKRGDILTEVNGKKIINGNRLNIERDKLFSGKIDFIDLKVLRNKTKMNFKLLKINQNKLINKSILKVRSSHPLKKERKFRWIYKRKNIKIFRKKNQRVFIAGDMAGIKGWAVDDTIIINGKTYPGIKGGLDSSGRSISDERKFPPLEITDIVPFDKKFTLKIQLANHGILFGNSDIYIVVK